MSRLDLLAEMRAKMGRGDVPLGTFVGRMRKMDSIAMST